MGVDNPLFYYYLVTVTRGDDMTKLSKRAEKALTLLREGAQFCERLESNTYTGQNKFAMRLLLKGKRVSGFGYSTFHELKGMLEMAGGGTTVSTYWKIKE